MKFGCHKGFYPLGNGTNNPILGKLKTMPGKGFAKADQSSKGPQLHPNL